MSNDLAWAAGFYDGEGSTFLQRPRKTVKLILTVSQKDTRVLLKLKRILGGGIYGPYGGRPCAAWILQGENAYQALMAMWPHLGAAKREQAAVALDEWHDRKKRYT